MLHFPIDFFFWKNSKFTEGNKCFCIYLSFQLRNLQHIISQTLEKSTTTEYTRDIILQGSRLDYGLKVIIEVNNSSWLTNIQTFTMFFYFASRKKMMPFVFREPLSFQGNWPHLSLAAEFSTLTKYVFNLFDNYVL